MKYRSVTKSISASKPQISIYAISMYIFSKAVKISGKNRMLSQLLSKITFNVQFRCRTYNISMNYIFLSVRLKYRSFKLTCNERVGFIQSLIGIYTDLTAKEFRKFLLGWIMPKFLIGFSGFAYKKYNIFSNQTYDLKENAASKAMSKFWLTCIVFRFSDSSCLEIILHLRCDNCLKTRVAVLIKNTFTKFQNYTDLQLSWVKILFLYLSRSCDISCRPCQHGRGSWNLSFFHCLPWLQC